MLRKSDRLIRCSALLAATALVFSATACDDSTGPQAPHSQLFVLNAAPSFTTAQLRLDQVNIGDPMPFWRVDGVFRIRESAPDTRTFTFRNAADTAALASATLVVPRDSTFLLIMTQRSPTTGGILLLKNDVPAIGDGVSMLRMVNAAPSANPVDVYILGKDETLAGAGAPDFTDVGFEEITARLAYATPADSVMIVATPVGSKATVVTSAWYSTTTTLRARVANTIILMNNDTGSKTTPIKQFLAGGL